MKKQFKILKNGQGFTLVEMLVNILIISSITVSMFFTFNKINEHTAYEAIKTEAIHYSNNVLDEIVNELRRTSELSYRTLLSRTKIQYVKPNEITVNGISVVEWENSEIIVDLNSGVLKNDSYIFDFDPKDDAGRTKYKLHKFKIEDVNVSLGDVFSNQAYDAREASRHLYLEVLLYKYYNQLVPSDTLRFTRRLFCPGLLIQPSDEEA